MVGVLILVCLGVIAIILFLYFIFWYYKTLLFWILFSPDYLVIVGGAGAYTINNTEWLTSSLGGRIAWGIMAMILVWAIYFSFNSALYKASEVAYRVISFALIVGCSLYIMFKLFLHIMEQVGPQLANDSTTNHIIYNNLYMHRRCYRLVCLAKAPGNHGGARRRRQVETRDP